MKTIQYNLSPGRRWRGFLLLATVLAVSTLTLHGAKSQFERTKPHVNVGTIGHINRDGVEFDFQADLQVFLDGEANGSIQFTLADGSNLTYEAIAGIVQQGDRHKPKLLFLLDWSNPTDSGNRDAPRFLVILIQQNSTEIGCDLWDLVGTDVVGGTRAGGFCSSPLSFELPHGIEFVRGRGERARDPFVPDFRLRYPRQSVQPEGLDRELEFHAEVAMDHNHRARGILQLSAGKGRAPLHLKPLLGLPIPDPVPESLGRLGVVLFVVAGAPLSPENLVFATVRLNAVNGAGCDLWDIIGTQVVDRLPADCHLRFDAVSGRPVLSPELIALAQSLRDVPATGESDNGPPDPGIPDALAPAVGIPLAIESLKALDHPRNPRRGQLKKAGRQLANALAALRNGSRDARPTHLIAVIEHVADAQGTLEFVRRSPGGRRDRAGVAQIQQRLSNVARRMASDLIRVAGRAGVSRERLLPIVESFAAGEKANDLGRFVIATVQFGKAVKLSADTLTFDVGLFELNILDAMNGEAVGYAYSITLQGQLFNGGAAGLARTAADPPSTGQSPNKRMHVASISKTLTAVVTLRLLEELGLTPDEPIAPYLPSNWSLGAGVDELTFRELMKHRSGFGQQAGGGSSYSGLQFLVAQDVGSQNFDYDNDNFGLLRVLVAGLLGIDPVDYPEFQADGLTSAAFILESQALYNSIGVLVESDPTDPNPTIQYNLPDMGNSGYEEPNRSMGVGGFGWFISANGLTSVMVHLRNTQDLLLDETWEEMQEDFLGFMNPSDGYNSPNGAFGVYLSHGGDWIHNAGELHSCVMAFPISVEASLLINSERGNIPYQCTLLRNAFDNAWVAN